MGCVSQLFDWHICLQAAPLDSYVALFLVYADVLFGMCSLVPPSAWTDNCVLRPQDMPLCWYICFLLQILYIVKATHAAEPLRNSLHTKVFFPHFFSKQTAQKACTATDGNLPCQAEHNGQTR